MFPRTPTAFVLVLLAFLLPLSACAPADGEPEGTRAETAPQAQAPSDDPSGESRSLFTNIDVETLRTMMEGEGITLVNVHIPFEGDIPATDVSIPFDEVAEHLDQLPQDRDAPIVLYCRSGRMSEEAATTLAGLGFTNLFNLEGGFRAWTAAGYPLEGGG